VSYQVLARKYRPRTFAEVVGQEHVVRALVHALDNDRVHHAYLFTGTRGVGKTTIARILAKSLNCDKGVSSEPCGECRACTELDEGRFVDLIEVDAASRTKVDDTRELLENVQYASMHGRYKVYLIDEVHMLSGDLVALPAVQSQAPLTRPDLCAAEKDFGHGRCAL
jgi:DNA polymerase-3 subunit gamma/tau